MPTTGTEGPDELQNDPDVMYETIEALGGDDIITILRPNYSWGYYPKITVSGGSGSDTLKLGGQISGASGSGFNGSLIIRNNSSSSYTTTWTSIEYLEVRGSIYGYGFSTPDSHDTIDVGNSTLGFAYISTNGGNDRITVDGFMQGISINAGSGDDVVDLTTATTYSSSTNRASGGEGNDIIYGGVGNERLYGDAGDDLIIGNGGTDYITGGAGNDTLVGDAAGGPPAGNVLNYAEEGGPRGVAVNLTSSTAIVGGHVLAPGTARDSYGDTDTLTGFRFVSGTDHGDHILGGAEANLFFGNGGDDILDGGPGADSLYGGTGNDIFYFDNSGDVAVEYANEGIDEIRSTAGSFISLMNFAEVENLTLLHAVRNEADGNDKANVITGSTGIDVVGGRGGDDRFMMHLGGDDSVRGDAGRDTFYFGGAFTAADSVDGGTETDQLVLQGDYAGAKAATLGALTSVEQLLLLSGSNDMYGFPTANKYSYDLTTSQSTVQPGQYLYVLADDLKAGENLTFNGSAETDGGNFYIFAGHGTDSLTGGSGADIFLFRGGFTSADSVNGWLGEDRLVLRQSFSGNFQAATMTNVERLVLLSGHDTNWGPNVGNLTYRITLDDGNVAPGQRLVVDGSGLRAGEGMILHGGAETNGSFELIGGAGGDILIGGAGDDSFYGGLGADVLQGTAGNDTYVYRSVTESTRTARDEVNGLGSGDVIDLRAIDADSTTAQHDQFSYIGSSAFSGTAGELRVYVQGSRWVAEADVNGDSIADLSILISTENGYNPVAANFAGAIVAAGRGDDNIAGTEGDDLILVNQGGDDIVDAKGGDDIVYFGAFFSPADKVDGGPGRDTVMIRGDYATSGPRHLAADTLKDVEALVLLSGSDARYEPAGSASRYFLVANDANVAAGQRLAVDASGLLAGEYLIFNGSPESNGAFDFHGGAASDTLIGGAGNDTFRGSLGGDVLQGGLGDDTYIYTSVAQSRPGARDQINGFGAGDIIDLSAIDADSVTAGKQEFTYIGSGGFTGGKGELRIFRWNTDYYFVEADLNGDFLADLQIAVSTEPGYVLRQEDILGVGGIVGTAGNDVLTGTDGADRIDARQGGDDLVNAGGGDDLIHFGDTFTAADRVDGGTGNDSLFFTAVSKLVFAAETMVNVETLTIRGETLNLTLHDGNVAAGAHLTIDASALSAGWAQSFIDARAETNGTLRIEGGRGHDFLLGGQAGNTLIGGDGNDIIVGGIGDDTLIGGAGADTLQGGPGNDTYAYLAFTDSRSWEGHRDQINGFAAGDRIDLSAVDAKPSTPENDAFTFIGANPFSGQAGQLRAYQSNGTWFVEADIHGDGVADLVILVGTEGGHGLGAGDFLL